MRNLSYQTILRAGKASQGIFRVGKTAIVNGQFAAAPITYIAGRGSLPILADIYSRGAPVFQTHGTAFMKYLSVSAAGGYLAWKSFIEPSNKKNNNNPEKKPN